MAQSFLTGINLNGNQLIGFRLENLGTAPTANVVTGRLYFNTGDKLPYWYDGSSWITFATSGDYTSLSGKVTVLEGYFTSGIANQAAKVTNALSFTAGAFSDPGDYNGSAAMTLKVPTTTAHITEGSNLYFTVARARAAITGGASTIVTSDLTVSRALVSDANGKVAVSAVTSTELSYLDGVTSAIQTQIDTIDDKFASYLPLSGGTMTGTITFGTSGKSITSAGVANLAATTVASLTVSGNISAKALRRYDGTTANTSALVQAVSNNTDITLFRVNYDTIERYSTSASYGYSLFYKGSDYHNRLYLMADNSTATAQSIALCVFQTGNVGIKGEANASYALTVNGKFYATGESLFASTIVAIGNIRLCAGTKLYGTKTDGTTAINLIEFTDTSMTINGAALATTSINSATTSVKALTATSITIGNVVIKEDSDGILKFFYKGDENGETNVATIYATGGVSALGLGVSSGGSGGGGIVETVWTYDNLIGTTLSEELTTDVATAWAVKKIYNRTNDNATNIASINSEITNIKTSYATQSYVNTAISNLIGGAPSTLDTLKELADAMEANKDAIASLEAIAGGKVSSVTVTGTGNAVTSASVSTSGVLTLTKGTTFLTSHQTIHSLTIKNSAGTTQLTYTPNSAVGSITLTKAMVGLGNVENKALSTWTGSSKITTVGTITSGTWQGTKIANTYLANSSISIAGTSVSLGGSITAATLQGTLDAVRKYTTTITGTGSATSFTVTHSLGTQALATLVFDSDYKQVFCDVTHTDTSKVTLGFGTAPSTSTTYTVVILA